MPARALASESESVATPLSPPPPPHHHQQPSFARARQVGKRRRSRRSREKLTGRWRSCDWSGGSPSARRSLRAACSSEAARSAPCVRSSLVARRRVYAPASCPRSRLSTTGATVWTSLCAPRALCSLAACGFAARPASRNAEFSSVFRIASPTASCSRMGACAPRSTQ
jgi:hypothetical protein